MIQQEFRQFTILVHDSKHNHSPESGFVMFLNRIQRNNLKVLLRVVVHLPGVDGLGSSVIQQKLNDILVLVVDSSQHWRTRVQNIIRIAKIVPFSK